MGATHSHLNWTRLVGLIAAVSLAAALPADTTREYETGIVYPIQDLDLSMPLDGIVTKVLVKAGDEVTAGQILLQLDDQLQQLEVKRRERIWRDDSQLDTTRENLELLQGLVDTKEELFESSRTVSQSELKRNQIQLNQVQGELRALVENKAKAEIEYQIAAQILASYQLDAPIAGEIVDIEPSPGEWVRAGDVVMRLVDTRTCYLDIDVDLPTSQRISNPNTKLRVRIDTGADIVTREGSADFVSAVADGGSGLVRVKVYFDNTDGTVTPGVTGQLLFD